jgi:hypothetical protein
LDGVILGARVNATTEEAILAAIHRSGRPIEVMRAIEDRDEYRLTIEHL